MGNLIKKIIMLSVCIAVIVVLVLLNDGSKKIAKEFLNKYYTVSDVSISQSKSIDEIKESLEKKYENLLTHNALEKLAANRWILESEKAANEFNCKLEIKKISLKQSEKDNNKKRYEYTVVSVVKYSDGKEKEISQSGTLELIKKDDKWIIDSVYVRDGELYGLMKK